MVVAMKFSHPFFGIVVFNARRILSVDDQKEVLPPSVMTSSTGRAAGRAAMAPFTTPGTRAAGTHRQFLGKKLPGNFPADAKKARGDRALPSAWWEHARWWGGPQRTRWRSDEGPKSAYQCRRTGATT